MSTQWMCKRCGSTERYASGHCAPCRRRKRVSYRVANREKVLAREKAYRDANREKVSAKHRRYYEANLEKIRAASRCRNSAKRQQRNLDHLWSIFVDLERKGLIPNARLQ